jgi:hypothetical protein
VVTTTFADAPELFTVTELGFTLQVDSWGAPLQLRETFAANPFNGEIAIA